RCAQYRRPRDTRRNRAIGWASGRGGARCSHRAPVQGRSRCRLGEVAPIWRDRRSDLRCGPLWRRRRPALRGLGAAAEQGRRPEARLTQAAMREPLRPISFDGPLGQQIIELHVWAVRQGLRGTAAAELYDGFCQRLITAGVPLWRGYAAMETL